MIHTDIYGRKDRFEKFLPNKFLLKKKSKISGSKAQLSCQVLEANYNDCLFFLSSFPQIIINVGLLCLAFIMTFVN